MDPHCPGCESGDVIGVEVRGVYDGVLYWMCEACGLRYHRFPEGHWLRPRAERHIDE